MLTYTSWFLPSIHTGCTWFGNSSLSWFCNSSLKDRFMRLFLASLHCELSWWFGLMIKSTFQNKLFLVKMIIIFIETHLHALLELVAICFSFNISHTHAAHPRVPWLLCCVRKVDCQPNNRFHSVIIPADSWIKLVRDLRVDPLLVVSYVFLYYLFWTSTSTLQWDKIRSVIF
jgi:hypothetical protein